MPEQISNDKEPHTHKLKKKARSSRSFGSEK